MAEHDILRGSHAWERLQQGIHPDIGDPHLRTWMHDWVSVAQIIVPTLNDLLDGRDENRLEVERALERAREHVAAAKHEADQEHQRIHKRIDRRGEDINALGAATVDRHEKLVERLFDSERGTLHKLATNEAVDGKVGKVDDKVGGLTKLLWTVLVSVTGAAIMLALNLATKGSG